MWTFSKIGSVEEITRELHDAPISSYAEEVGQCVTDAKKSIIEWMNTLPTRETVNVTIICRKEFLACQASIKIK